MNILICVYFWKMCHVIRCFPKLNQKFGKEDFNLPIFSSSRSIECKNKHLIELESYVDQINTSLYHDFTINKIYFKDHFIFKFVNYTRDTCNELFREQYIQLRTLFIPLCHESHDIYCSLNNSLHVSLV